MRARLHGMLLVPPTTPPDVDQHHGPIVPVVPGSLSRELADAFDACGSCVVRARAPEATRLEFIIRGPDMDLRLAFALEVEHAARLWARAVNQDGAIQPLQIALCRSVDDAIQLSLARYTAHRYEATADSRHFAPVTLAPPASCQDACERGVGAR